MHGIRLSELGTSGHHVLEAVGGTKVPVHGVQFRPSKTLEKNGNAGAFLKRYKRSVIVANIHLLGQTEPIHMYMPLSRAFQH